MGFLEENQYYIQLKLGSELRGLSPNQRKLTYASRLRDETRGRLQKSYNQSADRVSYYKDAIEILKDLDLEYLLESLYYEEDVDRLANSLSESIRKALGAIEDPQPWPISCFIRFFTGERPISIDNQVGELFSDLFQTSDNHWLKRGDNNEIVKKAAIHLASAVTGKISTEDLSTFLAAFQKYWAMDNAVPFNHMKGHIFLFTLGKCYTEIDPASLQVNLLKQIDGFVNRLCSLLPTPAPSPLLHIATNDCRFDLTLQADEANQRINGFYCDNIIKLKRMLENDQQLFQDLKDVKLDELLLRFFRGDARMRAVLLKEMERRWVNRQLPSEMELKDFQSIDLSFWDDKESRRLYNKIRYHNYLI